MNLSGVSEGFDYMPRLQMKSFLIFLWIGGRKNIVLGPHVLGPRDREVVLLQLVVDTLIIIFLWK